MSTIAVSAMMRLMPSVTPVAMLGRTLGSSTRRIVAIRVLPSAKAASRMCRGHRLQAVARGDEHRGHRDQRHHRAGGYEGPARDRASLAAFGGERAGSAVGRSRRRRPRSGCRGCRRRSRCSASTIRVSDWRARPPPARTRRSTARSRSPAARRSAMPMSVSSAVPISGSRKPPEPAWLALGWGRLKIRLGRRYWMPR